VQNIYAALEKTQTSMQAFDGEGADAPTKKLVDQNHVKKTVVNKSWLNRLSHWFKAQFK